MIFKDTTHGCLDGGGATGCHSNVQAPFLGNSNIAATIKGMKSLILCANENYVNPSDPKSSVLYKVVDGTSCDQIQMPQPPRTLLTDDQKACLADWISKL